LYFFTINACSETGFGGVAGGAGDVGVPGVDVLAAGVLGADVLGPDVEAGGVDVLGVGSEVVVEDEQATPAVRLAAMSPAQYANRVVPMPQVWPPTASTCRKSRQQSSLDLRQRSGQRETRVRGGREPADRAGRADRADAQHSP
jgi:hypothetical protein